MGKGEEILDVGGERGLGLGSLLSSPFSPETLDTQAIFYGKKCLASGRFNWNQFFEVFFATERLLLILCHSDTV